MQEGFSIGFAQVVRCFRVSGLFDAPFAQPLACMEFAGRVHSALARSKRSEVDWFSRPRLMTVRHTSR